MKRALSIVGGIVVFLAFFLGHIVGERAGYRRGVDAALDAFDCMTDLEIGRVQPPHTRQRCEELGVTAEKEGAA